MSQKPENTLLRSDQAVIFDLDGTLVDTLPDLQHALNRVLQEEGLEALQREEARLLIGGGARNLIDLAFTKRGIIADKNLIDRAFKRFVEYYSMELTVRSKTFPGVLENLLNLSKNGVGLGVCTNKPQDLAEKVLEELQIRHFFGDAIIGGDALPLKKPSPAHLLAVIEKVGRVPKNAFMVGDSETDVGAARNAGIPIIVVDFGYTKLKPEELNADSVISNFDELLSTLISIGFH